MPEIALNVPFDCEEIKEIATAEFRKRLDRLSPLQGNKEYAEFSLEFNVSIRAKRVGSSNEDAVNTLAWGSATRTSGVKIEDGEEDKLFDGFKTLDPNEERISRDMPLTVESGDGKGGKIRRKARVR